MLLPVTSVKINQQRRIRRRRREIIEYFMRPLAPEQILLAAKARFRIPAARDVCGEERFNRSYAAARRILPLALGERPIPPIRGVVCHVGSPPDHAASTETILQDGHAAMESRVDPLNKCQGCPTGRIGS